MPVSVAYRMVALTLLAIACPISLAENLTALLGEKMERKEWELEKGRKVLVWNLGVHGAAWGELTLGL